MKANNGDRVKVHYTGKLEDEKVFDSSEGRDPLEFVIGEHKVIPGFEEAVVGMAVGESKSVQIACDQAYGAHHDSLVMKVGKSQFPADIDPQEGQQLQLQTKTGQPVAVRVTDVGESEVTLDANHPLAGKDLNFQLELVSIN